MRLSQNLYKIAVEISTSFEEFPSILESLRLWLGGGFMDATEIPEKIVQDLLKLKEFLNPGLIYYSNKMYRGVPQKRNEITTQQLANTKNEKIITGNKKLQSWSASKDYVEQFFFLTKKKIESTVIIYEAPTKTANLLFSQPALSHFVNQILNFNDLNIPKQTLSYLNFLRKSLKNWHKDELLVYSPNKSVFVEKIDILK